MGALFVSLPAIRESQDQWTDLYPLSAVLDVYRTDEALAVNIIKVLGEGGFSFVYLAQDEHSGVSRPTKHGAHRHHLTTIRRDNSRSKRYVVPREPMESRRP